MNMQPTCMYVCDGVTVVYVHQLQVRTSYNSRVYVMEMLYRIYKQLKRKKTLQPLLSYQHRAEFGTDSGRQSCLFIGGVIIIVIDRVMYAMHL